LARQLQADKPGLKVIYTSGYSPEVARHGLELRSGENFVQKPYPPHQLLESVRRCLDA
jgi:two-component system, cell cycle sensor histidine kinase and response regulator CckA